MAIDELLSDGEWHSFSEILRVVGPSVNAAQARRSGVRQRETARRKGSKIEVLSKRVPDLDSGTRLIIRKTLNNGLDRKTLVRDNTEDKWRTPK